MEDNSNKENQDIEILEKGNEDEQKKQSCTTDSNPLFKGIVTARGRFNSWVGVGNDEPIEIPTNGKKSSAEKESEKEEGSQPKRNNKRKAERPATKTCKKVFTKPESLIQVRINYLSKINRDKEGDSVKRNEESSPVKKKMKNDIKTSKKIENDDKKIGKESIGSYIPEKLPKTTEDNTKRKVCIDCSETYCAEKTSKNKSKCLVCKLSEHGCIKGHNNCEISKGSFWMCKECIETVESKNLTNLLEKKREETGMQGMKRKRKESESESNAHKKINGEETVKNVNEESGDNMKKTSTKVKETNQATEDKVNLRRYKMIIEESDIELLKGSNWINDTIITLWMKHLQQVDHENNEKVLFVPPTITQLLKIGDTKDIDKTLEDLDAWWKDYMIFPVNDNNSVNKEGGSHWSLLIFSRPDNTWYHYDSNKGSNVRHAHRLVSRVNKYLSHETTPTLVETNCTQQNNSYDCGAFAMVFAQIAGRRAIKGEPLNNCNVDRTAATKMRERVYELIASERQSTKSGGRCENGGKKDKDQKVRDKKDKKRTEINEFISSICGEAKISDTTKRDIKKYYDDVNEKELRTKNERKEQMQIKIDSVCKYWAKDTCKKGRCIYQHPVRCEETLMKGYCNQSRYGQCEYYHPKICWDNLKQERCRRGDRCTFRHIFREKNGYDMTYDNFVQPRDKYRRYHDNEYDSEPRYTRQNDDFLWKNLYPWEKEQMIELWNQRRTERRFSKRWY